MIKKLQILLFILMSINVSASHYMGGEITWECFGKGKYLFRMRLYRECTGQNYNNIEIIKQMSGQKLLKEIRMTLVSKTDFSPQCNKAGPTITCLNAPQANAGAVEEWYYTSEAEYPNGISLNGVPPADGWVFKYTSPGANKRNHSDNIENDDQTWALRAIMFPYKGKDASTCFDNSPTFAEKPSTVICTGYHFTYNPNAYDNELDSLAYEWAPALDSAMNVLVYKQKFSDSVPLPNPSLDIRNSLPKIDSVTGEISCLSYTSGAYLTVSKVTAFKKTGKEKTIKVAEIYREMQIVLVDCNNNNKPPTVNPPFRKKNTGKFSYIDSVYAGKLVNFNIKGVDVDFLNPPNGNIKQSITINATQLPQFGQNFNDPNNGCLTPPCAILNPALPLSGKDSVQSFFQWQTTCSHLTHSIDTTGVVGNLIFNIPSQSNVHNFVFNVMDDYCPVPDKNISTISIVVLDLPQLAAPELRCASINGADITLSWIPLGDTTNSFKYYYIYTSTSQKGPFTIIDSLSNQFQSTYTYTPANNKIPNYFYMTTRSGCHGKYLSVSASDIINTMILELNNTGDGKANLQWNTFNFPQNISLKNKFYSIFREYPAGKWSSRGKTSMNQYVDTIDVCNATINYMVEVEDSIAGCKSFSNKVGDVFSDKIGPDIPQIDSVSIDLKTGKTVIGWSASNSMDTKGYYIYYFIYTTSLTPYDTILSKDITFYINLLSNPSIKSETYQIAAFDSCGNLSPTCPSHHTMLLSGFTDLCNNSIRLNWTPYINMNSLEGYRIYYKEKNDTIFHLLGNTTDNFYEHTNIKNGTTYDYFIRAYNISGSITSSSNIINVFASLSKKPLFAYLRYATVVQNSSKQQVELKCFADTSASISKCIILRSDSSLIFNPIASISSVNPLDISFIDTTAIPEKQSYSYKVDIYDSCGIYTLSSNTAKTIYLIANANTNLSNSLQWNNYEQWDGIVEIYNIYRAIGNKPFEQMTYTAPLVPYNSYTDDISDYTKGDGTFNYIVEAIERSGSNYIFSDVSRSNKASAIQSPKYYVPNAFTPGGYNNSFLPVGVFTNSDGYLFTIYNRWGYKIFETNVPNTPWYGTIFNTTTPAPEGIYVYVISYKDSQNQFYSKRGTVTLIR